MSRWLGLAGIVWVAIYFSHEVQAAKKANPEGAGKSYSKSGTYSKHGSNEPRHECVEPVGPIHGSISCYSEEIQKKCIVSCDEGYQLQGAFTEKEIVCSYNRGYWFPPKVPECFPTTSDYGANEGSHDIPPQFSGNERGGTQEVERLSDMCSNPSPPPFSTITCHDIYEGRKCLVRCYRGYVLSDRASQFMTECFLSGDRTWHPSLSLAKCSRDPSSYGSHNEYEGAGSDNIGSNDIYGLCKNLSSPVNGRFGCRFSSREISCNATCRSGFHFRNSPSLSAMQISCQKRVGGWSPMDTFPDCVSDPSSHGSHKEYEGAGSDNTGSNDMYGLCKNLSTPMNGRFGCRFSSREISCNATCRSGFHFRGSPSLSAMQISCQKRVGRWSPMDTFPDCVRANDWNKNTDGTGIIEPRMKPEDLCKFPEGRKIKWNCTSNYRIKKCVGTCWKDFQFRITPPRFQIELSCDVSIGKWMPFNETPECISSYPNCSEIIPPPNGRYSCIIRSNSNKDCTGTCFGFNGEKGLFEDGSKNKTLVCRKGIWENGNKFPSCKGMGGFGAHGGDSYGSSSSGGRGHGSSSSSNRGYLKPCGNPTHTGGVTIRCDSSNELDNNRECRGTCTGSEYKKFFADMQYEHILTCRNGEWQNGSLFPPCARKSGSTPTVQTTDLCELPPEPSRGTSHCSKTTVYKTCVALCNRKYGFKHGGQNETISCKLLDGRWLPKSTFSDCIYICDPRCENGGRCIDGGTCLCSKEYRGRQCQYPISNCDEGKIQFSGTIRCQHMPDISRCELKCPPGYQLDASSNIITCDLAGNLLPALLPKCKRIYSGGSGHIGGSTNEIDKNKPPPDAEWEIVRPDKKPGYEWGEGHGNKRPPFELATSQSTGVCAVWSTYHYRTFDGFVYDYAGTCSYILAKDDLTNVFSIILEHDNNCVNRRVRSGTKCFRTVKIKLVDAVYQLYAGPDGVVLSENGRRLPIPYTHGINVEYIARYIVVTLYQDTMVWIDRMDAIYIVVSENFKKRLLGLCGNYDDNYNNDMLTPSGTVVKKATTFGNSWKIQEAGVCEDVQDEAHTEICRHDSPEDDRIAETAAARCLNINEEEYKYCRDFVDPKLYIEACKIDCCDQKGFEGCECSSFAEYFRECARLMNNKYTAWRKPALCPMKCENGTKYQDCGSACPTTCGAPELPCTIKTCVDGCHCPEGMALHEKQCVPVSECPCQHNDHWYAHDTSLEINCKTCLCQGGNWKCTDNICPALCSSTGDSHFTTFDGKRYNFVGYCSYYLVHQEAGYIVEQENSDCIGDIGEYEAVNHKESIISCKKTVILKTPQGTIVKLKQGMEVTVNSKEVKYLPHLAPGVSIRQLTSLYQEAEFDNGLKIIWDGWNRIYMIAPTTLYGKVQGLCGTFNNFQNDDFITPAGDQEKSVKFFAEKWKVPTGCHDVLSHNVLISSPCDIYPHHQKEAEKICSKIKSDIFKDCKAVIDPEPFYRNCLYDVCSCKSEISSCFCSSLANYALVCARSNVSVDWRPHVPNCGLRCIGRQQYQTYIKTCEYSCRQIATLPKCETEYVEGCACPSGETLDADGNCVSIFECPCIYHNHEYVPNFVQRRGTKTCTCIKGRWQCHPSSVEELLTTPPSEVVTCLASDHKEYTDCLSDCPITCSNLHDPPTCTMLSCKSGCRCQQGYVLNEDSGVCVIPKDCPCHHGKRSYKDKEKIRIDCKECVCDKGYWKCDKDECPGLCSSWGNSHFMTFDGHFYDFQGTCEYVLASGKITEKETFSIIIQNEKCGSKGITCSKIISFTIGNDRITFSKNGPSPRINPDSRFSIKEVGMFVYVATDIGIYLQWDKGTRVYIHALPIWSGKLKGLCGDFNGDSVDDFKQPSGNIPATQAVDFANSWKMHPYCEKPMDIPDSCIFHSERRDWALKKCKVLRSFIFSECHSEVDLEPYYESCVFDTCACDMGGDCECLCTAIAAYAYECAHNGIYVYWRSQELCPIQCEDCDHYSPCISTCSPETCQTSEAGDTENVEKPCLEEPCSEGCERNKCPPGQVYNNTNDYKCIPKEECIVLESQYFCKNLNGRDYKIGELINDPAFSDQCRTCYCTRHGPECTGFACTSSPYAPTVVPEKSVCTSGWSEWLNFSSPNFEKTYHPMCPVYQISNIECRPMQSINDIECSLENGLNCLNGDYQVTQLCFKYEIRVHCDCDDFEEEEEENIEHTKEPETSTSVPPTACGLPMYTDWMNVNNLNIGTLQQLMYELRKNYTFCDDDDILLVECDITSKPGISHNKANRKIRKCVASDGSLICGLNSNFKKHCKVRVLCNCVIKDLQLPNVTCLEKTPWIDFDDPDDGIDFESIHRIPAIEKLCPKITSTRCRTLHNNSTRPPPATKFNIRCTGGEVACKTDSRHTCPDYAVISTCRCTKRPVPPNPPPKGSTLPSVVTLPPGTKKPVLPGHPLKGSTLPPDVCPSGLVWDNCAIDCQQTCKPFRNQLFQTGVCTKENQCVSGCRKAKCLYPNVWRDEKTCILERDCPCMTEAGDIVGPGQVLTINDCEKCHCLNNYMNCIVMASCTTGAFDNSLHYTGESIIQDDCWTHWINSDNPSLGSGDFEKLSVLQQKYNFCSNPIEVQCRDAITKRDSKDSYQDVTCNKEEGLICWNNRTRCSDYEIRFFCPCSAITPLHYLEVTATTAPQVCQQGWSVWFNNHTADNTGDYESLQLTEGNSGNKICVDGTISSVNCRRKKDGLSYSLTNQYVTCELEKGLLCENSKQTRGERCNDYEIAFFCDCFDQTTPKVTPTSAYRFPSSTSAFNYSGVNEEEHLPYTSLVPTAVHECWEFVPLINGEQKLPDNNLKASSRRSSEFRAQNIRISTDPNKHSGKAWIPAALNKDQYVEIDLSEPRLIYGIITQGREDYQEWVTSYYLLYSNDGHLFTQYKHPHSPEKVIPGNYDSRSLVKVIFDAPFEARYVRIQPNTWEGQIALRVELLGCSKISDVTKDLKVYVCLEPMGLENGKLSDLQLTAPSQHDWSHTPSDGRIGGNGWVAAVSDDKQYLQVDFLDSRVISAIVTQGRENENQWVSAYMVSYSNDGNTWTVIADEQDQSKLKIFSANYDDKHLVTNYLPRSLRTHYIRITPVTWKNWISMKMEILGCYHPYREIVTTTVGEIIYALPKETVTPSTQCLQPMGLSSSLNDLQSLPDELISVSSSEPGAGAPRLRLNTKASGTKKGGWIPKSWDTNPSVKIDFLIPSTLTSITTKGIEGTGRKINSYKIFVSNDSYSWNPVYSEKSEIFKGNDDDINEKNNMFDTLVTARYFKLEIIGSKNPRPGLRMEVFGCYHGYEMLPTTPLIPIEDQLESCIKYGPWKSLSDPNLPNSKGDFEKIKDIIDESSLCTNPVGIECQTYGAHISYRQTGQNVTCDLTNGLSCWNKDQRRNVRCYNYEVRIKCWTCPLERNDTDAFSKQLHCPELPKHLANNCPVCSNELRCNGTSCVDESSCPCIHGNKVFQMGYKIITKNCEECICSFGGYSTCHKKMCNLCKPEEKPVLLPDCSCSCESCKQGEKMCITNKQCILEGQWCDGIEDCPDDELNCLDVSTTPSESEATTGPPAELEKGTCELLGKRIRTVDGQELDYEICDHVVFLDALNKNFNVTVKKTCSQNPPACHKIYIIQQDETSIKIDNDMKVTINGNNYTASQLTILNKRNSNISVEIVGNHVIVKSKTYGFTVIRDQRANLKVEMPPEMKNKTIGLCGLYNGKAFDDKKKPDGSIAMTSKEFGDSWANTDSKECAISNCSSEFGKKAVEICKKLREDPFDICKDYLNVESYVQACVSSTCDCMMESEDKISECKCAAFLPLLEACENKLHIPLPKWRSKHGCAPSCPLGFVWEDCGNGCQLTCDNANIQEPTCLETCVAGCFCPAGTVLDGEKCVLPEECSNAMCQGFGDPHFSTFDGWYYPFQAAGRFVLATDKRNTFSVEGESGKCSPNGNETCLSALTINYNNIVINIRKGKPIVIGSKPVTMEMLPMQLNGITVLGFPGQVYLVIIPALGIVVRYYEINDGFSINIPPERFYNSTRGLCGNCNGQKNDEMIPAYSMIINTTSDFVCSWVKGESFTKCKKSFHEKSLVSIEDKCPEILDSTFESCHALVDPTIYQTSCNYDVAYSTDRHAAICKTLMEYSRKCCEAGVMLSDWFNKYNCDIPCPNGTIYHHCHDACPQTCQNTSETINCHDYKVDGCFCPENTVIKDGACVDEVYCKLPQGCAYTSQYGIDSKGKEFLLPPDKRNSSLYKVGETWHDGLCRNCTCKENSGLYIPYCTVTECPNYKNLADNLDYEIASLPSPGTCCPKLYYTSCKDEDGKLMKIGEKWQNKTDPCKEFQCEFSPEGQASKIKKDVKCECSEGEEEQPPAKDHCCGECIKKYCVANNMHYSIGEHWVYSKCYMAECIEENGQANLRLYDNCSQVSESCPREHIIRDQSGCCDICNTTLGVVGCNIITKDMKTGELEQEYEGHGKCRNPNPLDAVIKCSGLCESESMYYLENGEVASTCKCCSPVDIQIRDIVLKCDDNTLQKFQLKEPKACRCSPCAASAKNKGKTNPSKKGGSGDQQYQKYSNQNDQQLGQEYDSENQKQFHEEGNVNNGQNFIDDDI